MRFSLIASAAFFVVSVSFAQGSPTLIAEEWKHDVRGDGESILFIHGGIIAGTPEEFLTQESLKNYQLVTYNRRGYMGSPPESGPVDDYMQRHAADAAELMSRLGIDAAHIVGHSSGGTIALELALSNPGLVKSLVLLEAVVPVPGSASSEEQNAAAQSEMVGHLESGDFVAALNVFMEAMAGLPEWRTQNAPAAVREADAYAPTFFMFEGAGIDTWAPPTATVSEDLFVLYVSGSESPHPKESVDVISAWFPKTIELEIPAVSHGLHMEDPGAVAEGIAGFLDQL